MDNFEKCKSCKFYKEYYTIRGSVFGPIGGHCFNNDLYNPRKRKNFCLIENCEHWQKNDEVIENRNNSIKEALFNIENHLNCIKQILEINSKSGD